MILEYLNVNAEMVPHIVVPITGDGTYLIKDVAVITYYYII